MKNNFHFYIQYTFEKSLIKFFGYLFSKYRSLIRRQNLVQDLYLFLKQAVLSEGQHSRLELWKSGQVRIYRCKILYYFKYLVRKLILIRHLQIEGQNKEHGCNYNITHVNLFSLLSYNSMNLLFSSWSKNPF